MHKSLIQLTKELAASQRRTFQLLAKFNSDLEKWIAHARAGYPVEKS